MTYSDPAPTASQGTRLRSPSSPTVPTLGITVYGCGQDEARLFRDLAPRFGITPVITEAVVSNATTGLADGTLCISVGHKSPVTRSELLALRRAGVEYVSTRSIGRDHIDVAYANRLGMTVENVAYSPDSVADFTLMQMLMVMRNATSIVRRVDVQDFRLHEIRGKELRDMIVGVVGTGRIGAAVIERLRGFGCRILAYDKRPKTTADYVSLEDLLDQSDIVSLHTPLTADTHHLLNRHRIGRLKFGAIVINTGRGALIDTEALLAALLSGSLGGAALDVLEGEEGIFYTDHRNKPVNNPLLLRLQQLPNVLLTPHTAYYTEHALIDTVQNSMLNCLSYAKEHLVWTR